LKKNQILFKIEYVMKQEVFQFGHTADLNNYQSARVVLKYIMPYLNNVSCLLDLGGGMGAWSAAFNDIGIMQTRLVDHPGLDRNKLLLNDKNNFEAVDLDKALPKKESFDMAICIEVLEHFKEDRALEIHQFLCESSDLILFSAAIPGQNGIGHLNCQRHAYWHKAFADCGFHFFDGFKPSLLGENDIYYWIRQNLFFYYRPNQAWRFEGKPNISNMEFELVHNRILTKKMGIKEYLKMAPSILFKR